MLIHTDVCLNTSRLMPEVSVREPQMTHSQKPPMVLVIGMLRIPGVSSKAALTLPEAAFVPPSETVRTLIPWPLGMTYLIRTVVLAEVPLLVSPK